MDPSKKAHWRQAVQNAELTMTRSILRWKSRRRGEEAADPETLENRSKIVADQVHEIISRRGKNIWNELKSLVEK